MESEISTDLRLATSETTWKELFTLIWRVLLGLLLVVLYFTTGANLLAHLLGVLIVVLSIHSYWTPKDNETSLITEYGNQVQNFLLLLPARLILSKLPVSDVDDRAIARNLNPHLGFTAAILLLLLWTSDGETHRLTWFTSTIQAYGAFIFATVSTGLMWEEFLKHSEDEDSLDEDTRIEPLQRALSTGYGLLLVSLGFFISFLEKTISIPPLAVPEFLNPVVAFTFVLFVYLSSGIEETISTLVGAFQVVLVLIIIIGLSTTVMNWVVLGSVAVLIVVPMVVRMDWVWNRLFEAD